MNIITRVSCWSQFTMPNFDAVDPACRGQLIAGDYSSSFEIMALNQMYYRPMHVTYTLELCRERSST
jgi:hypothetical protein